MEAVAELKEQNKVFAEFMGLKNGIYPSVDGKGYWTTPIGDVSKANADLLPYHSSWEWLMPVVKKIASIFDEWDFEEERRDIAEEFFYMDNMFSEFLQGDITAIHGRCYEFIEWYKKQEDND